MPAKASRSLFTLFALCIALIPKASRASDVTLQGSFAHDDDIQLFDLTVAAAGSVDIRSYGYAGGTTSTGTVVPRGGFDTILTLFDSTGMFLMDNDDGVGVAVDPRTGLASDARITMRLTPGSYTVALTQFDNFSIGNLADGFAEAGNPNFTADPSFTSGGACPGNMFRDISGTAGRCRDGNWAVDFLNVASVKPAAPVPEPGTIALFSAGLLGLALLLWSKRRAAIAIPLLLAAVFSTGAQAQGPDYSNVSDFLDGNRTLLAIDDLVINGYVNESYPRLPDFETLTLTTANSQPSPSRVVDLGAFGIPSSGAITLTGHMFHAQTATTVVLRSDQTDECVVLLPLAPPAPCYADPPIYGLVPVAGAMADFNGDGYDDLVMTGPINGQNSMIVATAADVNNVSNPSFNYGPPTQVDPISNIVIGDFNGDGRPEIAGLSPLPSGGVALVIYTVDPKTLAISKAAQITLQKAGSKPMAGLSIAKGRFSMTDHDQIIVASTQNGVTATILELIDFAPQSLTPQEETTYTFGSGFLPAGGVIKVKTGKFSIPTVPYDQVAFMFAWHGNSRPLGVHTKYVNVLSIDPSTLVWNPSSFYDFSNQDCGFDIAVGNFDNRQPDPVNPGQTEHNPNNQIALLYGSCTTGAKSLDIINMDPKSFAPSTATTTSLPSSVDSYVSLSFTQSDIQGRSYVLGEPEKITIGSAVQPSVVIGAPPMHVDFISPDPLSGKPPEVLNLSAVPDGFNTTYEVENTDDQQSGGTNTTSWSFGAKESIGVSAQIGDPDEGEGLKVSDTLTAAQDLKGSTENEHGHYTRNTYNIYQATGFGDQVSYIDSEFNIWVYPVLGRTVCPAATPNCPANQKVPLTIQFSAPNGDAITHGDQGQALQWYQPPWEPGNIFSYPANLQQLQLIYPNLTKLTTGGAEFITDTSTQTQKTTWAVGSSTGQTTSFEQNYSFENDFSDTGAVGFLGITAGASLDIDISGSFGLSNLNKSTTDLGTSTGIGVKKPGTFPPFQNYGYSVTPYILGTTKPGGSVDNLPLSTDIKTFGLIRGVFTADPLASDAGGWWQQAYSQAPDVALNHPSRWHIVFEGLGNPVPSNCLTTGTGASQMDCAELSQYSPKNPWLSIFHQMRGFFISNASAPGQGPQLEQAKAGDVLTLQTRVYNYSLAAMPRDSQVHVRFYFQPWKGTVAAGDSVLIGEDKLSPIPPFRDDTNALPNWVLASTTFDTGKYDQTKDGNVYIVFWVVVWMQTPDGKMVPEMPGHGLAGIPGTLTSLADVKEECQKDGSCYGNNLGFYKQAFYIFSKSNGLGAPPLSAQGPLDIGKIDVSARRITPRDTISVSATLSSGGTPVSAISAAFYDGDPENGGVRFGVERVPYLSADASYDVATTYRTNSCGTHELFVVLNQGKPNEIVRRAPPVRVDCAKVK